MKTKLLVSIVVALCSLAVEAQTQPVPVHYYVTIGVFARHDNAMNYANTVNKSNFHADYALRLDRKLYYVYLLDTDDKRKAFAFLINLRVETDFKDAWVYKGYLGSLKIFQEIAKPKLEDLRDSVLWETVARSKRDSVNALIISRADSALLKKEERPEGKPFFFEAINRETGAFVSGEVQVISSPQARQYQSFPVNSLVYIKPPVATDLLEVTVEAAGYKEMRRIINYTDIEASSDEMGSNQEAILSFPMARVTYGDYIEFSNVRFFQNSAILQPESRDELDGLADMMKEKMRYKIRVHGHCNGTELRGIVSKGTSTEFFAHNDDNLKWVGTPKELSKLRAETIKGYLVSQGVDSDRISIKGEGSNHMIFPENSIHSSRNDRVEVQISRGGNTLMMSLARTPYVPSRKNSIVKN